MSLLKKYLTGWQFRTTTPDFEVGEEYRVVITGYDETEQLAMARVGDTVLYLENTQPDHVDTVAKIRITEFDENEHTGSAEVVDIVGKTTY